MGDEMQGKSKGGFARAEILSPERRAEIAKSAAAARWGGEKLPRATHEGRMKLGSLEVSAAVLADGRRLLTQSDFMRALGRARQAKGRQYYDGDVNLPAFLTAKNLREFISKDLEVTSSQIEFITIRGAKAFGYAAELLPSVCEVFLQAADAGKLTASQLHIADRAKILIRALASTGIIALVDEATGYQEVRPRDALQAYLEKIVAKELAAWAKKFPDEFYENIYKLKGWTWPGMQKNRYSVVAYYTTDLVYERIAPGLLEELLKKSPPNEKGHRTNKLHQWLTEEVGNPLLSQHMHSLIMFQKLAISSGYGWNRFVKMVDRVMPKLGNTLELPFPDADEIL
ncbi:MAG: P63C domain-containing protein [Acidobacteriaceae bacterium]|nr:P63C domain-containing protein [Acidobacteriaceae bacterium]